MLGMTFMTPRGMQTRIEEIKRQLATLGAMRPGSLSKQYNVCGKAGCRCKDQHEPKKHGPYYQLSYVHRGKSTSQFVRPQFVAEVKKQLATFKRFRELTDEWVELSVQYGRARLEELKRQAEEKT